MKSLRPKKLSFDEMWKLYKLLKVNKDKLKDYLADELQTILETVTPEGYLQSLNILYGNNIKKIKITPIDSVIMLSDGLNANGFFDFCATIEGINGSS